MDKEKFLELQKLQQSSGLNIKDYCKEHGISYSSYNYWRQKFQRQGTCGALAPVSFNPRSTSHTSAPAGGVVIQLPNGVQIEFSQSNDTVALQVLTGMCSSYVLPK